MRLKLSPSQSARLDSIVDIFRGECGIQDNLQEEMLRIILKRFIITCTRIAREKFDVDPGRENMFDVIRQFYVLVDSHLRRRSKYRIMLICCAVLPRLFLISFPFTDFLLLCVSFMNAWMRKPSACCFIRVRVRKKSVRFWDLRIWLRSAVSLRNEQGEPFGIPEKREAGIIANLYGEIAIYRRGKTTDLCTRKLNLLIMKAMMAKLKSLFVAF